MASILTNTSAMVALQNLRTVNSGLEETQSMISTGKAISSARDNAAVWTISKVMESDAMSFKAINDFETEVEVAGGGGGKPIVGRLTDERIRRLEDLGFIWSLRDDWQKHYDELKEYKREHGNCNVPVSGRASIFHIAVLESQLDSKHSGSVCQES